MAGKQSEVEIWWLALINGPSAADASAKSQKTRQSSSLSFAGRHAKHSACFLHGTGEERRREGRRGEERRGEEGSGEKRRVDQKNGEAWRGKERRKERRGEEGSEEESR